MRLDHTKEMHFLDVILTPAYTHTHSYTQIHTYWFMWMVRTVDVVVPTGDQPS